MPKTKPPKVVVPVQGGNVPTLMTKALLALLALAALGAGLAFYSRNHRQRLQTADGATIVR